MAGPGRRGTVKKPSIAEQLTTNSPSSRGSKACTSRNNISGTSTFANPNSSPLESQGEENNGGQPHSSESHVAGQTEPLFNDGEHENEAGKSGQSSVRKRGSTRNIALGKKRHADEKLPITVEEEVCRIVGNNSQFFITESGCVVRKMARHNAKRWSKLEEDHREDMSKTVMEGFEVDELPCTKAAIDRQMNTQYRNRHYKLHLAFQKYGTKEEAMKHVPENIRPADWLWLCEYFSSEVFKELSERNKKNRADLRTPTTVGTKSLARLIEEKKRKEGKELSEIELYEISRFSEKKGTLVNDIAKEKVEKMKELQATTSMTQKEICLQEVGRIPGQNCGRVASKKQADLFKYFRAENENNERRAKQAEEQVAAMADEIQELKAQQNETNRLYQHLLERLNALGK